MVIVRLIGGLGNQLFQYAAARNLAIYHDTELKLDNTLFDTYKLHKYSLDKFNIQNRFASVDEIENVTRISIAKKIIRKIFPFIEQTNKLKYPVFREDNIGPFNPSILDTPKNVYLEGYWQSEKYFLNTQDIIRQEFSLSVDLSAQSQAIAEEISNTQAVSIHIRRGDYVLDVNTNERHGTCDLSYYHNCIKDIRKKITSPHFFVFSDDPDWAIRNLKIDLPVTYVTHNDALKNHEDLCLMSICDHNIIANSSFSWWGAWLNNNQNKLVYTPSRWLNDTSFNIQDLIPIQWIKME